MGRETPKQPWSLCLLQPIQGTGMERKRSCKLQGSAYIWKHHCQCACFYNHGKTKTAQIKSSIWKHLPKYSDFSFPWPWQSPKPPKNWLWKIGVRGDAMAGGTAENQVSTSWCECLNALYLDATLSLKHRNKYCYSCLQGEWVHYKDSLAEWK